VRCKNRVHIAVSIMTTIFADFFAIFWQTIIPTLQSPCLMHTEVNIMITIFVDFFNFMQTFFSEEIFFLLYSKYSLNCFIDFYKFR